MTDLRLEDTISQDLKMTFSATAVGEGKLGLDLAESLKSPIKKGK
ncbi:MULTISPECIES: hypothetical protein [Streptomyces]|jgi:hypothetical protein|nr:MULTISPECIES: hypothetical protein [Streptomyces]